MFKKINLLLISSILSFPSFAQNTNSEFMPYHQLYQMKHNTINKATPNFGANVFFSYENLEIMKFITRIHFEMQDKNFYNKMISSMKPEGEIQRNLQNKINFVDGQLKLSDIFTIVEHFNKIGSIKTEDKKEIYDFFNKFKHKDGKLSVKDFLQPIELMPNNQIKANKNFSVFMPVSGCFIVNKSCDIQTDFEIINLKNNEYTSAYVSYETKNIINNSTHSMLSLTGFLFTTLSMSPFGDLKPRFQAFETLHPGKYKLKFKIIDRNNPERTKINSNSKTAVEQFEKIDNETMIYIEKEIEVIP